ncbi:MAG: site-specific integrase [Candidatus Onthovivens sp.]|nr:site-specific integrase [Candidatus Onthovivens sp.]
MPNNSIQEMIKLNVPKDFGKIDNISNQDPFKPWLVNAVSYFDKFDNPIYEEVGRFETFNQSLLALIMVNTLNKKKKNKVEKSFLDNKIDEFFINTGKEVHVPYFPDDYDEDDIYESYPGHGPLIVKFKKSKPKKEKEVKYIYINNSSKDIDFNTNLKQSNPLLDYSNPLMNLTFKEVYERWYRDKSYEDISPHTMEGYRNSYKKCEHLADKKFVEIRFSEIENCVRMEKERGNSFSMRKRIKLFFSQLYQWGISHEICTNNIALNIKLGKNESDNRRKPFTPRQIATLFAHVDEEPFIESVLMLIFTGCRIREFLNIKREDIHMDQRYFVVTESKTKAGRNRLVPINKKIMKYFRKRLRAKSNYLIHDARGRQVGYSEYSTKFRNLMKRFNWEGLSCHCCRHTCATLLYSAGAKDQSIKRILGHVQGSTVTERVYIHIQLKDLLEAIDLI